MVIREHLQVALGRNLYTIGPSFVSVGTQTVQRDLIRDWRSVNCIGFTTLILQYNSPG